MNGLKGDKNAHRRKRVIEWKNMVKKRYGSRLIGDPEITYSYGTYYVTVVTQGRFGGDISSSASGSNFEQTLRDAESALAHNVSYWK